MNAVKTALASETILESVPSKPGLVPSLLMSPTTRRRVLLRVIRALSAQRTGVSVGDDGDGAPGRLHS